MPTIQWQLQFEYVALLSATYGKLVHWVQVSRKAHEDRLAFTLAHIYVVHCSQQMLATYPRILIDYVIFVCFNFCELN